MAARTSREEVIAAAINGEDPSVITTGSRDPSEEHDVESKGLERTESQTSFNQYIGVTKIESLCKDSERQC